jgi:hypothetical protein
MHRRPTRNLHKVGARPDGAADHPPRRGLRHLKAVDHLVPVDWIREADADLMTLNRTRFDVTFEPSFTVCSEEETEHDLYESGVWVPLLEYEWLWPCILTDAEEVIVVREESPPTGEVAWGKRARAYDASGVFAGRLTGVDLERGSGKIRRVFLRKEKPREEQGCGQRPGATRCRRRPGHARICSSLRAERHGCPFIICRLSFQHGSQVQRWGMKARTGGTTRRRAGASHPGPPPCP